MKDLKKIQEFFSKPVNEAEKSFSDYSNNELAAYVKNNPADKAASTELHKRSQKLKNLSRTDEAKDDIKVGDMVKVDGGGTYKRVEGTVGGYPAFVRVEDGKEGKQKTSLVGFGKLTKVTENKPVANPNRHIKGIQIQLDQLGVKYEMDPTNKVQPFKVIYKPVNKDDEWYDNFDDLVFRYNLKGVVKSSMNEIEGETDRYNRPIVTDKQGKKFILQGFSTSGYYLIPYDGDKYWEPSKVSQDKWIPEKDIDWNNYNFTKQQFEKLKASHGEKKKEIIKKFQDMNEAKEEDSYEVVWTDRDYKKHSKVFKNDPKGAPDNAKKKSEAFKKALEDKDKKSKDGLYRSIDLNEAKSLMLDKYEVDFYPNEDNVHAYIEIPSDDPTSENSIYIKGVGETEKEAFEDLEQNYENYKKTGINEASKEEETEFHKKLDKLVHDTFGKRKGELEEEVDQRNAESYAYQFMQYFDKMSGIVRHNFGDDTRKEFENIVKYKFSKYIVNEAVNLKASKLSSAEYQKAKKLKDFKASDWKYDSKEDLYTKVNEGNLGHAEVKNVEKNLSPAQKEELAKLIKSGKIKTSKDLKNWQSSKKDNGLEERISEALNKINEELCPAGKAYIKRRKAAGEKSSAYLSGRAVKVCKGQMSGRTKKKK